MEGGLGLEREHMVSCGQVFDQVELTRAGHVYGVERTLCQVSARETYVQLFEHESGVMQADGSSHGAPQAVLATGQYCALISLSVPLLAVHQADLGVA